LISQVTPFLRDLPIDDTEQMDDVEEGFKNMGDKKKEKKSEP